MKTFVYCTPTHLSLLTEFLNPSLPVELDLKVIHGGQDCPTGSFMKDGWLKCMEAKVQMLIDAIRAYPDEILLHLDVDIQFFTPSIAPIIQRYLERVDLVAQNNDSLEKTEVLCGGLFAFRANERTLGLFHEVLNLMKKTGVHDQDGLNQAILTSGSAMIFSIQIISGARGHFGTLILPCRSLLQRSSIMPIGATELSTKRLSCNSPVNPMNNERAGNSMGVTMAESGLSKTRSLTTVSFIPLAWAKMSVLIFQSSTAMGVRFLPSIQRPRPLPMVRSLQRPNPVFIFSRSLFVPEKKAR